MTSVPACTRCVVRPATTPSSNCWCKRGSGRAAGEPNIEHQCAARLALRKHAHCHAHMRSRHTRSTARRRSAPCGYRGAFRRCSGCLQVVAIQHQSYRCAGPIARSDRPRASVDLGRRPRRSDGVAAGVPLALPHSNCSPVPRSRADGVCVLAGRSGWRRAAVLLLAFDSPSALAVLQRGNCAQSTVSERARLRACVRAAPSNCHTHPPCPPRLAPPPPPPLPAPRCRSGSHHPCRRVRRRRRHSSRSAGPCTLRLRTAAQTTHGCVAASSARRRAGHRSARSTCKLQSAPTARAEPRAAPSAEHVASVWRCAPAAHGRTRCGGVTGVGGRRQRRRAAWRPDRQGCAARRR